MDQKPTYKQVKFLLAIEKQLDIKCKGKTRKEISDFISENIDKFYESKQIEEELGNELIDYDYF